MCDLLVCGSCSNQYDDLIVFIRHKQTHCQPIHKTSKIVDQESTSLPDRDCVDLKSYNNKNKDDRNFCKEKHSTDDHPILRTILKSDSVDLSDNIPTPPKLSTKTCDIRQNVNPQCSLPRDKGEALSIATTQPEAVTFHSTNFSAEQKNHVSSISPYQIINSSRPRSMGHKHEHLSVNMLQRKEHPTQQFQSQCKQHVSQNKSKSKCPFDNSFQMASGQNSLFCNIPCHKCSCQQNSSSSFTEQTSCLCLKCSPLVNNISPSILNRNQHVPHSFIHKNNAHNKLHPVSTSEVFDPLNSPTSSLVTPPSKDSNIQARSLSVTNCECSKVPVSSPGCQLASCFSDNSTLLLSVPDKTHYASFEKSDQIPFGGCTQTVQTNTHSEEVQQEGFSAVNRLDRPVPGIGMNIEPTSAHQNTTPSTCLKSELQSCSSVGQHFGSEETDVATFLAHQLASQPRHLHSGNASSAGGSAHSPRVSVAQDETISPHTAAETSCTLHGSPLHTASTGAPMRPAGSLPSIVLAGGLSPTVNTGTNYSEAVVTIEPNDASVASLNNTNLNLLNNASVSKARVAFDSCGGTQVVNDSMRRQNVLHINAASVNHLSLPIKEDQHEMIVNADQLESLQQGNSWLSTHILPQEQFIQSSQRNAQDFCKENNVLMSEATLPTDIKLSALPCQTIYTRDTNELSANNIHKDWKISSKMGNIIPAGSIIRMPDINKVESSENPSIPVIYRFTTDDIITKLKINSVNSDAADLVTKVKATTAKGERLHCAYEGCTFSAFKTKDLIRHTRKHTGERPYTCSVCCRVFSRQDKLTSHSRLHLATVPRPHPCPHTGCTYRAQNPAALRKHVRTHTNERPFQCQLCPYSAKDQSQLVVHIRKHTGDLPFTCLVSGCRSSFRTSSDLKRHQRVHVKRGDATAGGSSKVQAAEGSSRVQATECSSKVLGTEGSFISNGGSSSSSGTSMTIDLAPQSTTVRLLQQPHDTAGQPQRSVTAHSVANAPVASCSSSGAARPRRTVRRGAVSNRAGAYRCQECPLSFVRSDSLRSHQRIHQQQRTLLVRRVMVTKEDHQEESSTVASNASHAILGLNHFF